MSDLFEFAKEKEEKKISQETWKILVVDDEKSIHDITQSALKHVIVDNRQLELVFALSAEEAKQRLDEHNDFAMALIDVIMETPTAGLDLVNYIRNDLKNSFIRLVIRTGQPHEVPEREVIDKYDINDYKEKTELTVDKLYTVIRSSIKQYTQLIELANKYEDVYRQMTTHPLTRLPNRQKLNEALDTDGAKDLVLINIDNFGSINESQGFDVGDELLKQMGAFLVNMYSQEMDVFHLEADIFGILCSDERISEERLVRIKTEINKASFLLGGIENHLSVTMGLVMHEEGNIIQKAEFALKEARSHGKNRITKYSKDIKIIQTIQHNSIWIKRIQEALAEDRFVGYFQPIFDIKTGEIVKYECLVRMLYEDQVVGPFQFLECARSSGQLYAIFKIMFEAACKKSKEFSGQFTINMTDLDLQEPDLISFIDEMLERYTVNPRQIGLEILEQKSIINNIEIKKNIVTLADKGMAIIIDDFGTECSNFGQLVSLPISLLKIDGSFIKDLNENVKHKVIVESIIEFSRKMNIPMVAEFVHSEKILDIVTEMGINYAQGYHLGEPQPELVQV
jgi:diguanylate cyclase (GGDEF)-like protein